MASAGAVEGPQHVEQADEDWHLDEGRQAGGHGSDSHFLLELAHLDGHCLLVVLVLLPQLGHFGLEFLHLPAGTHGIGHGFEQKDT